MSANLDSPPKVLRGQRLRLAAGLAEGGEATAKYRALYAAQGYALPDWDGGSRVEGPGSRDGRGPGAHLKALLARIGLTASADCGCAARAAEMDRRGVAWCRANVEIIVGWLRDAAGQRKLPFVDFAARQLVKLAIRRAERAEGGGRRAESRTQAAEGGVRSAESRTQAGVGSLPALRSPPSALRPSLDPTAGDYRCAATVYNRDARPVALHGTYRGASAFLICAGPSLADVDPADFARRGALTMAVNNAAAVVRPQLWCAVDAPRKFVEHVWLDPAIAKFVPLQQFPQRPIAGDPRTLGALPAVYGYRRNAEFRAERFLSEASFSWGCAAKVADDAGVRGTRSVFLVALKILYYLGVRRVFLVGCDWHMDARRPYAFAQTKDAAGAQRNNNLYRVTGQRLARLEPHFERAGFQILNATPGSRLDVFPRIDFAAALDEVTRPLSAKIVTEGRY